MPARLVVCALLVFTVQVVKAEQRFYQVVDPDGRVHTLVDDQSTSQVPKKTDAPASPWGFLGLKKFFGSKADVEKKAVSTAPASQKISQPPSKWAPYDSDEYLDSEILDSTSFNPEKKSNFYIINDGVRARVEERVSGDEGAHLIAPAQEPNLPERAFTPLPDEYHELTEVADMRALLDIDNLCLAVAQIKKIKALKEGEVTGVQLDRQALNFVKPRQILEVFRMDADGGGMLTVMSYASTERKPAFGKPVIAFAAKNGCVTRVLTGYFQHQFEATKTRYSMLQAHLTLRPQESYFLVVVPEAGAVHDDSAYKLSKYGTLGIKWQK